MRVRHLHCELCGKTLPRELFDIGCPRCFEGINASMLARHEPLTAEEFNFREEVTIYARQ